MSTKTPVNGFNSQGQHILHAVPSPPEPVGLGRYMALCGTTVRNVTTVPYSLVGVSPRCSHCSTEFVHIGGHHG